MSRPSARTSSQRSSACLSRGCVTSWPWCQTLPFRSIERPIVRNCSICSGVKSGTWGQAHPRDPVLGEQLLLLEPAVLDLLGGRQRRLALEGADQLVETAVLLGELRERGFGHGSI